MILPTLKQLQYLVALHDHGHFGRAAGATFVTQSTLSAGLRELEGALGAMLVETTRRVVRFPPLGAHGVAKARRVLRVCGASDGLPPAAGHPLSRDSGRGGIPLHSPLP